MDFHVAKKYGAGGLKLGTRLVILARGFYRKHLGVATQVEKEKSYPVQTGTIYKPIFRFFLIWGSCDAVSGCKELKLGWGLIQALL